MNEDMILNMPVTSLQQMLRTIAYAGIDIPVVIPDGIYGDTTKSAVSAFQQKSGLPATGIVDHATHTAIANAHKQALERLSPAQPIVYHFPATLVILSGQYHPHVRLAQAMLQNLRLEFPGIPAVTVTGCLDEPTQEALKLLQVLSGFEVTGHLDKTSWNRLARIYRSIFDRSYLPSQG